MRTSQPPFGACELLLFFLWCASLTNHTSEEDGIKVDSSCKVL